MWFGPDFEWILRLVFRACVVAWVLFAILVVAAVLIGTAYGLALLTNGAMGLHGGPP